MIIKQGKKNGNVETMQEVWLKTFEGKTIFMNVNLEMSVLAFIEQRYNELKEKDLSIGQWMARFSYLHGARTLILKCSLKIQGIKSQSTIHEISRACTMAKNFDWQTKKFDGDLDLEDDIKDPLSLNPGCLHTISKKSLLEYSDPKNTLSTKYTCRMDFLRAIKQIEKKNIKCWFFFCQSPVALRHIVEAATGKWLNETEQMLVKTMPDSVLENTSSYQKVRESI
jgi:hypothetical protein